MAAPQGLVWAAMLGCSSAYLLGTVDLDSMPLGLGFPICKIGLVELGGCAPGPVSSSVKWSTSLTSEAHWEVGRWGRVGPNGGLCAPSAGTPPEAWLPAPHVLVAQLCGSHPDLSAPHWRAGTASLEPPALPGPRSCESWALTPGGASPRDPDPPALSPLSTSPCSLSLLVGM